MKNAIKTLSFKKNNRFLWARRICTVCRMKSGYYDYSYTRYVARRKPNVNRTRKKTPKCAWLSAIMHRTIIPATWQIVCYVSASTGGECADSQAATAADPPKKAWVKIVRLAGKRHKVKKKKWKTSFVRSLLSSEACKQSFGAAELSNVELYNIMALSRMFLARLKFCGLTWEGGWSAFCPFP